MNRFLHAELIADSPAPAGPAKVLPQKLDKSHVSILFNRGPLIGEGKEAFYMYQCNCEILTGRKCCRKFKDSVFNNAPATAGVFKIRKDSGFQNLFSHTYVCLKDDWAQACMVNVKEGGIVRHMTSDSKSRNLYRWIELIIGERLPISHVSKTLVRKYSNLKPIARNTLMKYMDQLSFDCEGVLIGQVPDLFALIFDGWDDGNSTNYLGIFITYYDKEKGKNLTWLLRLSPLLRADNYSADSHIETITVWLENIGKSMKKYFHDIFLRVIIIQNH